LISCSPCSLLFHLRSPPFFFRMFAIREVFFFFLPPGSSALRRSQRISISCCVQASDFVRVEPTSIFSRVPHAPVVLYSRSAHVLDFARSVPPHFTVFEVLFPMPGRQARLRAVSVPFSPPQSKYAQSFEIDPCGLRRTSQSLAISSSSNRFQNSVPDPPRSVTLLPDQSSMTPQNGVF